MNTDIRELLLGSKGLRAKKRPNEIEIPKEGIPDITHKMPLGVA